MKEMEKFETDEELLDFYSEKLMNGWSSSKPFVFVSYAKNNWKDVYPTVMALREQGYNIYLDTEMAANAQVYWIEKVKSLLFDAYCQGMIAFLSIDYMRSYACMMELLLSDGHRMHMDRGEKLPTLYIALEDQMRTPQSIGTYFRKNEIRVVSKKKPVQMQPEEVSKLCEYFMDYNLQHKVIETDAQVKKEVESMTTAHEVAMWMFEYIFNKSKMNIQPFRSVEKCCPILIENFKKIGLQSLNRDLNVPSEGLKDRVLPEKSRVTAEVGKTEEKVVAVSEMRSEDGDKAKDISSPKREKDWMSVREFTKRFVKAMEKNKAEYQQKNPGGKTPPIVFQEIRLKMPWQDEEDAIKGQNWKPLFTAMLDSFYEFKGDGFFSESAEAAIKKGNTEPYVVDAKFYKENIETNVKIKKHYQKLTLADYYFRNWYSADALLTEMMKWTDRFSQFLGKSTPPLTFGPDDYLVRYKVNSEFEKYFE